MKKAVLYLRVSTDEQAESGTSLETQEFACLRKAAEMGAQVVEMYRDEGVSGALYLSREGLQKALSDIESGRANILIVYSISRLSRDVEHQQIILKRLKAAGARLVICDMPVEDTEEGELMFGISGTFAQYERQLIRKRTMDGRRRRAEEGRMPYRTRSPFGYYIPIREDMYAGRYSAEQVGTYLIVEAEAEIVRELFRRYAAGASLRGLGLWLDSQGVPTRQGAPYWKPVVLRSMLMNHVYKGLVLVGKREYITVSEGRKWTSSCRFRPEEQCIRITIPAIVDEQTWEMCQQRLTTNRARFSGHPGRRHLLSGILICPQCGKRMKGATIKGVLYYRCYEETFCPYRKHTPGSKADGLISRLIRSISQSPHLLATKLHVYSQSHKATGQVECREELQEELKTLQAKERATVQAQIAGIAAGADPSLYDALFTEIATKKKFLTERLAALEARSKEETFSADDTAGIIAQAFADVETVLDSTDLTPAEKNRAVSTIIHGIYPPVEGEEYRVDLAALPGSGLTVSRVSTCLQVGAVVSATEGA